MFIVISTTFWTTICRSTLSISSHYLWNQLGPMHNILYVSVIKV